MESLRTSSDDFVRNVVNREFVSEIDDDDNNNFVDAQLYKKPATMLTLAEMISQALLQHKKNEQQEDEIDAEQYNSDKSEFASDNENTNQSDDDEQLQLALAMSLSQVEEDERRRIERARRTDVGDLQRSIRHQLFDHSGVFPPSHHYYQDDIDAIPKSASFEFDDIDHLSHTWETDFQTAMDRRRSKRLSQISHRKQRSSRFVRVSANLFDEVLGGQTPAIKRDNKEPEHDPRCPFPPHMLEVFEGPKKNNNAAQSDDHESDTKSTKTKTKANNNNNNKKSAAPVFDTGNTTVAQSTRREERLRKKKAAVARFGMLRSQRRGNYAHGTESAAPKRTTCYDYFDHFRYQVWKRHQSYFADPFAAEPYYQMDALSLAPVSPTVASRFMNARQGRQPAITFHGTAASNHQSICEKGFLIPGREGVVVTNGSAHGVGIYSSRTPTFSVSYSRGDTSMFVCAVIDDTNDNKCESREGHCVSKNSQSAKTKCVNNIVVSFDSSYIVPMFKMQFSPRQTNTSLTTRLSRESAASLDLIRRARMMVHRWQRMCAQNACKYSRCNVRSTSQALDNML